jgi:hypothetical protein
MTSAATCSGVLYVPFTLPEPQEDDEMLSLLLLLLLLNGGGLGDDISLPSTCLTDLLPEENAL